MKLLLGLRRGLLLSVLAFGLCVTVSVSPRPASARPLEPHALAPQAPAPTAAQVTVDGQTDVAYAERGGTQTFQVGDMLDMASLVPHFITASNPEPDFYNNNGWYTANAFFVYPNADCSGHWLSELSTGHMQPTTATASATFSGAVRTYSVEASQGLHIRWLEKSIDAVDSVDEIETHPLHTTSSCVTVRMTLGHINLLANGSTSPTTVVEGSPIGLQTDQPTGDGWTQQLIETNSECAAGTIVATSDPGETVGTTILRPPGDHWFIVRAMQGTDEIYTNCVQVTVESIPASLKVEGQSDWVEFITGQTLALFVQDFSPGAQLAGLVYSGSTTCTGTAYALTSGTADGNGTLDTTARFDFVPDLSVRFVSLGAGGELLETTNCVALYHQDTDIELLVNGSRGPVLVDGGEIHLVATGLPTGAVAYPVLGCTGPFEPDDFGQVIGDDGVFEAFLSDDLPDEFTVRVALEPESPVSSNCVLVRLVTYLIDPIITINGSDEPPAVTSGTPFELAGQAFPPDRTASVRSFPGVEFCAGASTVQGAETDAEGNLVLTTIAGAAGVISYQVEVDEWVSNCVTLTVNPVPPIDPPDPVVPDGPIILRANSLTTPQVVASGTQVDLVAENLGEAEMFNLRWYPTADCTGTLRPLGSGTATTGAVGAMIRNSPGTVGFQLVAGERTSNCVQVEWLAAPAEPGDPEPLTIIVPADITRPNDPGEAGAVVAWPEVTTNGGVGPVAITCSRSSGDVFPLGTTSVDCAATDSSPAQSVRLDGAAALSAGASFTVTVTDVEAPAIEDLPDIARVTDAGSVTVDYSLPSARDNSGVPPAVGCSPTPASSFAPGVHPVTCTATDRAGNEASSTFTITVTTTSVASTPDETAVTTPLPSASGQLPAASAGAQLPETGGSMTKMLAASAGLLALGMALSRTHGRHRRADGQ